MSFEVKDNLAVIQNAHVYPAWNPVRQYRLLDLKHTPYNKRAYEVHGSHLDLTVNYHVAADWIEIQMAEYTTAKKGGKTVGRTLSKTLSRHDAKKLRIFLQQMEDNQVLIDAYSTKEM